MWCCHTYCVQTGQRRMRSVTISSTFLTLLAHFIRDNIKKCQMKPQGGSIVPYGGGKLWEGAVFLCLFQLCSIVYISPHSFPFTHVNMIRNYDCQTFILQNNWGDSCMQIFYWHDESPRSSDSCRHKSCCKKQTKKTKTKLDSRDRVDWFCY